MKVLREAWHHISKGENIELYITVCAGFLLTLLNLLGIADSFYAPITLAILSLLAISMLVNRHKMDKITNAVLQAKGTVFLEKFPANFMDELKDSQTLWLIGHNLGRTLTSNIALFESKLRNQRKIRLLIVDPNGGSIDRLHFRSVRGLEIDKYRAVFTNALSMACALKQIAPEYMEIRIIDYPLPFGFLAGDIESKDGVIYFEQYSFKMEGDLPVIIYRPEDGKWYDFYQRQIETLWNYATEWDCKTLGEM